MLIVSVSIYVVDTFLAVNLLAFNKWAGQIEPAIPFKISRWIFAGCIILSYVLLIERWIRAVRVMKQGGVAKSYLDPLAIRVQSVRMGANGRGYRRFLVFAELTKSRKGADYVALFSYYSFEAAIRIIFAEGPRVVVNAITLYSVADKSLIPTGSNAAPVGQSPVAQFFINIGHLAENDKLQATILFGMVWTCLIWLLQAISLGVSVVLYLVFLWHHIPSEAGGLKNYCRIKINKRMERVVRTKTDTALKKENALRAREESKAARAGLTAKSQPTLPVLGEYNDPTLPPLSRTTTTTTLPSYESRPPTTRGSQDSLGQPPMPTFPANSRPGAHRVLTFNSESSFGSNAPLMSSASDMGYSDPPPMSGPFGRPLPPNRSMTGTPNSMHHGTGPSYPLEPLGRPGTAMSNHTMGRRASDESGVYGPDRSQGGHTPSWDRPNDGSMGRRPPMGMGNGNPSFPPIMENNGGRASPAFGLGGPPRRLSPPTQPPSRGPLPFDNRSFSPMNGPPAPQNFGGPPPPRSYTPIGGPPLARAQTAEDFGPGGFRTFTPEPRSQSRGPQMGPNGNGPRPNLPYPPNSNYRPRPGGGDNDVRDILDHY